MNQVPRYILEIHPGKIVLLAQFDNQQHRRIILGPNISGSEGFYKMAAAAVEDLAKKIISDYHDRQRHDAPKQHDGNPSGRLPLLGA